MKELYEIAGDAQRLELKMSSLCGCLWPPQDRRRNQEFRRTKTDNDGRFEIEVIEGDELIIDGLGIETKTIIITDKNCYKIYLNNNIVDYPFMYPGKELRKYKRQLRKIEKEVKRKEDNGFYNCYD